ncbi:unnamed protein product [Moneuplotes crassus]|uniref:Uncharacterized protein n=1 Tax=Euplotes crassus TaxID=5936 RepID=A0AAD1Y722_EUPCR|nr:unnamed protein product [Moneuplotes crassus]
MPKVEKMDTIKQVKIEPDESFNEDFEMESSLFFNESESFTESIRASTQYRKTINEITEFKVDADSKEDTRKFIRSSCNNLVDQYIQEETSEMESPGGIAVSTPYLSTLKKETGRSSPKKYILMSDAKPKEKTSANKFTIGSQKSPKRLTEFILGTRESFHVKEKPEFISIKDNVQEDYENLSAQKENINVKELIEKYSPFKVQSALDKTPQRKSSEHSHNFSNSNIEEKKVVSMNFNKYSTSKNNKSGQKIPEARKCSGSMNASSIEFAQADQDLFKTFEEYNEGDYTYETFEEVLIEEQDGSKWLRVDKDKLRAIQEKYKGTKLGRAFNHNFITCNPNIRKKEVRFEKPHNYPHGFTKGEDAMHKVEKYENQDRYKSASHEREVTQRMNRYNSQDNIMSVSLKSKLSPSNLHMTSQDRKVNRSNSNSQRRYNLSSFVKEAENKSAQKPKKMKKDAFDKIYRRFMESKRSVEVKIDEKRRTQRIKEENEFREIEKARKRVGSKTRINNYIKKVQDDIQNRMYKAECMKHKKCLDQQREQQEWFKPQTNVQRYQQEYVIAQGNNLQNYTPVDEDIVTFEQSKEFNHLDYDMYRISERDRIHEMDEDFEKLKQKKENLQKVTDELLYPKVTGKIPNNKDVFIINKVNGRNSEYCGTSMTTSHETYTSNMRKIRKKSIASVKKGSASQKSLLCLSGSKSRTKMIRSPVSKPGENLHSMWADYINDKNM